MATMSMQTALIAKPAVGLTRPSAPTKARTSLVVRATAKQNGVAPLALKAFGALTAMQLALMPVAGPALADEIRGTPGDNSTDGAEYGKTRANYPGLGDIKGPQPKSDIGGGLDIPKTLGAGTLKQMGKDASNAAQANTKQLSKAGEKLRGPG
ncbi:hypothetical protein ABBQ38_013520 [Trebouxia sp. C0009 RCD-2024]